MPCKNAKIWEGKSYFAKNYTSYDSRGHINFVHTSAVVPCGVCLPCRIETMRQWQLRLLMESMYWEDSCFLTLTYDDEHLEKLPASDIVCTNLKTRESTLRRSLDFDDLSAFWKAIRQDFGKPLRYFACGEYGSKYNRPHFHAIVFGLGVNNYTRDLVRTNWKNCESFLFDGVKSGLAFAEADSMLYTCGYVRKKLVGDLKKEVYTQHNLEPPQGRQSQGLGWSWYHDNRNKVLDDLCIHFRGKEYAIPRYFVKKDEELQYRLLERGVYKDFSELQTVLNGDMSNVFTTFHKPGEYKFALDKCTENYYRSAEQYDMNVTRKFELFERENLCEGFC